jgi:hypothetical protein
VACFVLLVISGASGMSAMHNQVLYWFAPHPPRGWMLSDEHQQHERDAFKCKSGWQRRVLCGEKLKRFPRGWKSQELKYRLRYDPAFSYKDEFWCNLPSSLFPDASSVYNILTVLVQFLAFIVPPSIVYFIAHAFIAAQGDVSGFIAKWRIVSSVSLGWVIGAVGIWSIYLCLGGLRLVERAPRQLMGRIVNVLRFVRI